MNLVVGAGHIDRVLENPEDLLTSYRSDDGLRYLDYKSSTDPDRLMPEDLAVTILINSRGERIRVQERAGQRGAASTGEAADGRPGETTPAQRDEVADLIAELVVWKGFATSVATKILHKKRPQLIPILDNEARIAHDPRADHVAVRRSSLVALQYASSSSAARSTDARSNSIISRTNPCADLLRPTVSPP